jgi:hypothetical protein
MGFPEWTLWGMGLSIAGALVTITLSWLGQSPHLMRRLGLSATRLDLRVRALTGYALALLFLAIAFFLAGVPLEPTPEPQTLARSDSVLSAASEDMPDTNNNTSIDAADLPVTPATPETGAFSGPPLSRPTATVTEDAAEGDEPTATTESQAVEATGPITPTTGPAETQPSPTTAPQPTATATSLPTETPFPTLTPTAIAGETATVSTSGSTLWLKRSPGGQNLVLVRDGDIVLLRSGRANQAGVLWREVATVTGVEGWLQDQFLVLADQESSG